MIDNKYIKIVSDSPDLFIENYLFNGALSSVGNWNSIGDCIYEYFPYLSIIYLLRDESGFCKEDFVNNNIDKIKLEDEKLRLLVRDFSLFYAEESNSHKSEIESLNELIIKENKEKDKTIEKLTKQSESLAKEIEQLTKINLQLKKEIDIRNKKINDITSSHLEESNTHNNNQEKFIGSLHEKLNIKVNGEEFNMTLIDGGSFDFPAKSCLHPTKCNIKSFYCSDTLVTENLWNAVMFDCTNNPKTIGIHKTGVNELQDCMKFIEKLNTITKRKFRLLTEAEWHYAAIKNDSAYQSNLNSNPPQDIPINKGRLLAQSVLKLSRLITEACENVTNLGLIMGKFYGEYVLDNFGVCSRVNSAKNNDYHYITKFNQHDSSENLGLRLALSTNEQDDFSIEFVDLGLPVLWSRNTNILSNNPQKRRPTIKEFNELLKLERQYLQEDDLYRIIGKNGQYIYVKNKWYKSSEWHDNKTYCCHFGHGYCSDIYDKSGHQSIYVVKNDV